MSKCKRGCGSNHVDVQEDVVVNVNNSSRGSNLTRTPGSIRRLLNLFADDDDMRVTLILSVEDCDESVLEGVQVIGVNGDLVVVRLERERRHGHKDDDCDSSHSHERCCCGEIEFINICCICAVKVCCDDILEELLEGDFEEN
jgi:hypothetical protein